MRWSNTDETIFLLRNFIFYTTIEKIVLLDKWMTMLNVRPCIYCYWLSQFRKKNQLTISLSSLAGDSVLRTKRCNLSIMPGYILHNICSLNCVLFELCKTALDTEKANWLRNAFHNIGLSRGLTCTWVRTVQEINLTLRYRWTVMVLPLKMRSCLIWALQSFQSEQADVMLSLTTYY